MTTPKLTPSGLSFNRYLDAIDFSERVLYTVITVTRSIALACYFGTSALALALLIVNCHPKEGGCLCSLGLLPAPTWLAAAPGRLTRHARENLKAQYTSLAYLLTEDFLALFF